MANRGTVYLIMQPSVRRDGGLPNLEPLNEYGPVKVLVKAGEYPTKDPQHCLDLIQRRLQDFNPESDYLVWVGGDTLAAVLTGVVLADMSSSQDFESVNWLRYHRPRGANGERTDTGARYFPVRTPLWPTNASGPVAASYPEDEDDHYD